MRTCVSAVVVFAVVLTLSPPATGGPVTFAKDAAPIFFSKCVSCHRPGEIAPFSLLDYESARPWAKSIQQRIVAKTMPPWHADSHKTAFLNDRSLTDDEIKTVATWVDQGAKLGDAKDLPQQPAFNDTWAMGEPDFIFHATRDFPVPANAGNINYQSIHFDPLVDEDLYIVEWEIRPTARASVHHANLVRAPVDLQRVGIGEAVQKGGDYIGSYLPGARPFGYPAGTALRIPKGSRIQIQSHYVALDHDITDHMMFGVKFAQGRVDKIVRTCGTDDSDIRIAPGDANYRKAATIELLYPVTILSSGAHMHLRGAEYSCRVILPGGEEKLIADVPRYDFNWQVNYELANPVQVPAGTKYRVEARWDNSDKNPNNPDPSAEVTYGPWTENEMLTTWSHIVLTDEKLGLKVENGKVVGKFDDAVEAEHPPILQTLPETMQPDSKSTD